MKSRDMWRLKPNQPLHGICQALLAIARYTETEGNRTICGLVRDVRSDHPELAGVAVELEDGSIRFYDSRGLSIPAPVAAGYEITVGEAEWHAG